MEENMLFTAETNKKIMRLAIEEAEKAYEVGEVAVGCVFVRKISNEEFDIVIRGHNQTMDTKNATLHCEIVCLRTLLSPSSQLPPPSSLILFVTCEPCIMCAYALNLANIKAVCYGCSNERFGGNGSILKLHAVTPHPYLSIGGVEMEEGKRVLKEFYERGNMSIPEDQRHRKKLKKD